MVVRKKKPAAKKTVAKKATAKKKTAARKPAPQKRSAAATKSTKAKTATPTPRLDTQPRSKQQAATSAEDVPHATLAVAGTVSPARLLDSATLAPPDGAS